ncbi:hypothetical protein [Streptomyces nodosus]|uniref:hypothetical protein n=1 Tax=Streptomyces nodosus TaxID=40318 RepID=UPI003814A1C5
MASLNASRRRAGRDAVGGAHAGADADAVLAADDAQLGGCLLNAAMAKLTSLNRDRYLGRKT